MTNQLWEDKNDYQSTFSYDANGNITNLTRNADETQGVYAMDDLISHKSGSSLPNLEYIYDAAGNRVIKKKIYSNPDRTERDNYVIDAQGNIMTIYSNIYNPTATESIFIVEEQPIYGSSRLGTLTTDEHLIFGGTGNDESLPTSTYVRTLGQKNYELTDHLGHVRAIIKDYVDTDTEKAQVKSLVDYYAFGMEMPKRKYNQGSYRFGFNGAEKDDEISGVTSSYLAFEYRIYDSRIGRFLSFDPLFASYPWNSTYAFAENRVIDGIDLEGLEYCPYIRKFQYYGNGWDYVAAIDNGVINILNTVPQLWNSGVANYQSLSRGTYLSDLGGELKQTGIGIKDYAVGSWNYTLNTPVGQQFLDAGQQLISPQTLETAVTLYAGAKITIPKASTIVLFTSNAAKSLKGTWVGESLAGWSQKAISYQEYVSSIVSLKDMAHYLTKQEDKLQPQMVQQLNGILQVKKH